MRRIFSILFLFLSLGASSQIITLETKVDSLVSIIEFSEKLHQIYPYDVLNTGDNPWHKIRGFYMTDGPHGYRYPESTGGGFTGNYEDVPESGKATSFPISVAVAATWDTDLAYRMAKEMGKEFVAKGINQALSPALYLCNEPRNGRSGESFGEDPFLASEIAVSTVLGMQSYPLITTIKSYIGENAQNTRMTDSITIGRRMLMEHWGLPYRKCIQDANALCVMSAYVRLNDLNVDNVFWFSSENYSYNTEVLREKWGFPYYMVSDWGAVHDAELAIESGLDLCMGTWHYATDLWQPIISGDIPYSIFESTVKRVIRTKLSAGIIGWQPKYSIDLVSDDQSIALCYEAGVKSLVLLKNENSILPLNASDGSKVALIGPSVMMPQLDGFGSSYVFATYFTTVLESVANKIGLDNVLYAHGCDINSDDESGFTDAINAASNADYVIFVGGLDWQQEGEEYDRITGSTALPGKQQELINQIAAVNPNVIVVLLSGGIVSIADCVENIKALIYGFYPGQEQGNAIADVIFGDYNPGGKLPVTMPVDDSQLPPRNNNYNDDWGAGYRWFDKNAYVPQFAFGHGLSYTTFSYDEISVQNSDLNIGDDIVFSVTLTNTGGRTGEEVVQIYLGFPDTEMPMPVKQLKCFKRVEIASGSQISLDFVITPEDLFVYDTINNEYKVLEGNYVIMAGGASDNLPLSTTINLSSGELKPDIYPASLLYYPPFPRIGDTVFFYTNIKNAGVEDLSLQLVEAELFVESELISGFDTEFELSKAGMVQIQCDKAIAGKNWWVPLSQGNYQAIISLDPQNLISECNETNNQLFANIHVYDSAVPTPEINLAFQKPIFTSSCYDQINYSENWAVDGFRNSAWKSQQTNDQYVVVDLLENYVLNRFKLSWGNEFSKDFDFLYSNDSVEWHLVNSFTTESKLNLDTVVDFEARYLKIISSDSDSAGQISIYEIQAYSNHNTVESDYVKNQVEFAIFPNPILSGNTCTLIFEEMFSGHIMLLDSNSKLIFIEKLHSAKSFCLKTSGITPGIYYVIGADQNSKTFRKIIIY
ncbi:MAG TPA: glycoside hydrolase family 3 C-terminal domain-containing protein [Bacteroidales bacterium]|nr:glycoside hydrolase family 3 C-terminal domain-containing protein [Bacteroidales bacterium]